MFIYFNVNISYAGEYVKKVIVLNTVNLSKTKLIVLNKFFSEYLKVLEVIRLELPKATSSVKLHHLVYYDIRKISWLPSDIISEARKDVWARRKSVKKFTKCSIRFNSELFTYFKTNRNCPCFKITYIPHQKRLVIPIKMDAQFDRFESFLDAGWTFKNISLVNSYKIAIVIEKEFFIPHDDNRYILGIDVGSATLAAVSIVDTFTKKVVKQLYFGRDVAIRQRTYNIKRAKLQSLSDNGSCQAQKSLKRFRNKQSNFVKTRSGQIAKEIVLLAKSYRASIAIEKLKGLRKHTTKFNKKTNRKINHIPYAKLKEFLFSNATMLNIPIVEINAYHTSKWCPDCGAINSGHHSGNYALYKCSRCGLIVNSDRKASLAIAIKSVLERGIHKLTSSFFLQFSKIRVPVNGLLRPDEIGDLCLVDYISSIYGKSCDNHGIVYPLYAKTSKNV